MQKQNRSPIDTGPQQKHKVADIGMPQDWWDIAPDQFFCRIPSEDPYWVNVDKMSEESYKEAHKIPSTAIKEFDISKAADHTASIRMFRALFSITGNQAHRSAISCQSTLRQTRSSSCARSISYRHWVPFEWWPPKASNKANLSLHIPVWSFRLWEWSTTEHHSFYQCPDNQLRSRKRCFCIVCYWVWWQNLMRELKAWFHMMAIYIPLPRWGDSWVFVTCSNCSEAFLAQLSWWQFPPCGIWSRYMQEYAEHHFGPTYLAFE